MQCSCMLLFVGLICQRSSRGAMDVFLQGELNIQKVMQTLSVVFQVTIFEHAIFL